MTNTGRKYKHYPWRELRVGQVHTIEPDAMGCGTWTSFRILVAHTSKRMGIKFKCKRMKDGTMQLWRAE
jgi:hypothetical protein